MDTDILTSENDLQEYSPMIRHSKNNLYFYQENPYTLARIGVSCNSIVANQGNSIVVHCEIFILSSQNIIMIAFNCIHFCVFNNAPIKFL